MVNMLYEMSKMSNVLKHIQVHYILFIESLEVTFESFVAHMNVVNIDFLSV